MQYELSIDEDFAQDINNQFVRNQQPSERSNTSRQSETTSLNEWSNHSDTIENYDETYRRQIFLEKILASTSIMSLLLSIAIIYEQTEQQYAMLVCQSILTLLLSCIQAYSIWSSPRPRPPLPLLILLLTLPHPSPLTPSLNPYLHLLLPIRLFFPLRYLLKHSTSYNPRSFRVSTMYGMQTHSLLLCLKAAVHSWTINSLIVMYLGCVLVNTHLLYAVRIIGGETGREDSRFLESLSDVCITFTTVGYGDFEIQSLFERLVLSFTICNGVIANAFVILSSVKRFHFEKGEENSHTLLKMLIMKDKVEITNQKLIARVWSQEEAEEQLRNFRADNRKYRTMKGNANRMGMIENMASRFKDGLTALNGKTLILRNMMQKVMRRLREKKVKRDPRRKSRMRSRRRKFLTSLL